MATLFEARKAALSRMQKAKTLAEKLGYTAAAEQIAKTMEEMCERKLVVVIAGEVKRGKSSLLNAFLNEVKPICPMAADVCTNTVTIIQYGETERIEVVMADKNAPDGVRAEVISRDEITQYASEEHNAGNFKDVLQINAFIPNALLKEGVVFIDTPGVGSLNPAHAEITNSLLPGADMLLFVSDSLSPMTQTELDFLKRGYKHCQSVVFPLTKKDLVAEHQEIQESNREKISKELGIPEEEIEIIPVSSVAKLKYLEDPQRERMYRNSNFSQLENAVWTAIAKRQAEVRILPYMLNVEMQLMKIADLLLTQRQAAADAASAEDLNEKLEAYQKDLETIQEDGAAWQIELGQFFTTKQIDLGIKEDEIKRKALSVLEKKKVSLGTMICRPENIQAVLSEINETLVAGLDTLYSETHTEMSELVCRLYDAMKLDYMPSQDVYKPTVSGADTLEIDIPHKSLWESAQNLGREMNSSRFGLVAVCSTLGTIVGGIAGIAGGFGGVVVGGAAGQAVGTAIGHGIAFVGNVAKAVKKTVNGDNYTTADVNQVVNEFRTYINDIYVKKTGENRIMLKNTQPVLTNEFKKQITNRVQEIKRNIAEIKNLLKMEKEAKAACAAELDQKLELLNELIKRMGALREKIGGLKISAETAIEQDDVQSEHKPEVSAEKPVYGFL